MMVTSDLTVDVGDYYFGYLQGDEFFIFFLQGKLNFV